MRDIPIGTDDFRKVREGHYLYVDKSLLIRDVLGAGEVLLLPRPRRFGKTLNMTMLQTFFDQSQNSHSLFEGLAITADPEAMTHLNAYPTVLLTLKSVNTNHWEQAQVLIKELIADLFRGFRPILNQLELDEEEQAFLKTVFDPSSALHPLASALKRLTQWLFRATDKKVILLIDEYDTPIHSGHAHGYYSEMINFMRGFLGGALKGNPYLERAVITGILRVGKESIYSGLNNLTVSSILEERFSTYFGFTEEEVAQLLLECSSPHPLSEVQSWYNGYRFGSNTIYNPWSILKMLELGAEPLKAHWLGTSGNELIMDLVKERQAISAEDIEVLLLGGSRSCEIQESVAMVDLDAFSVWSLLLFSGYLTISAWDPATMLAEVCLPNREVRMFFERNVARWLGHPGQVDQMKQNLLALRLNDFLKNLAESIKHILSYHDVGPKTSEKTYHIFMVGLLASLHHRYEVLSNRESGYGRYDLALLPREPGLPGFIFEFKQGQPQSLAETAEAALAQIAERDYASTMRQRGVAKVVSLGLAFSGKRVALASSVQDVTNPQPSEVVHYQAGEPELEKSTGHEPDGLCGVETDLTQKAFLAGQIQLLQKIKGQKPLAKEVLLASDIRILESMLESLQS